MLDIEDVISRIPEGVALLDEKAPGWFNKIDLTMLNMSSCKWCVLGQVFGNYQDGREALDIVAGDGQWYGFDLLTYPVDFEELDQAWRTLISERQSA